MPREQKAEATTEDPDEIQNSGGLDGPVYENIEAD